VRVGKEAAHLPILRFGRRSAPEKKIERKGAKGPVHVLLTGTVLFFRKCAGEVTDGCPGRRTAGISRLSAGTCCAIPWPELSRPTPRMSAPLLQIRAPPDHHARSRPTRATQFAPMPLLPLVSRLELCIKAVRSASYGPTQPKRGVVGCRLKLQAPLRARGKTPSGQVCRSREGYGCSVHAAHDSRRLRTHAHIRTRTHTHALTHTHTDSHVPLCRGLLSVASDLLSPS
jgi:hypothetical protein